MQREGAAGSAPWSVLPGDTGPSPGFPATCSAAGPRRRPPSGPGWAEMEEARAAGPGQVPLASSSRCLQSELESRADGQAPVALRGDTGRKPRPRPHGAPPCTPGGSQPLIWFSLPLPLICTPRPFFINTLNTDFSRLFLRSGYFVPHPLNLPTYYYNYYFVLGGKNKYKPHTLKDGKSGGSQALGAKTNAEKQLRLRAEALNTPWAPDEPRKPRGWGSSVRAAPSPRGLWALGRGGYAENGCQRGLPPTPRWGDAGRRFFFGMSQEARWARVLGDRAGPKGLERRTEGPQPRKGNTSTPSRRPRVLCPSNARDPPVQGGRLG